MKKKIFFVISILLILIVALFILIFKKDIGKHSLFKSPQDASASILSDEAAELEAKGGLLGAKKIYQRLVQEFVGSRQIMNWQKKIEALNIKLLFSPTITDGSTLYEIKSGDTLEKIAKQFNTNVDLIMKSNNLSSSKIIPGRKLKVWKAPFTILIDKSQNILLLKTGGELFKTYIVSTGRDNCTPTGTFKITNDKITNPTWFKGGKAIPPGAAENILGTRWLGLNLSSYGIHGTNEPQNLGQQITEGCVRMSNPDVEELYTIVPVGTEVIVVD